MKIIRELMQAIPLPRKTVVTVGNFDGVHLGHREIFRRVVEQARKEQGIATVVTFEPHPLKLLAPERAPLLINTYGERERLIEASCIELLVVLPFTPALAAMPAEQFVKEILVEMLGTRRLIIGYDYAFGRGRQGNAAFLRKQGRIHGFDVEELAPISRDKEVYSSTRIRQLLLEGEVEAAVTLLGRHFTLEGEVVHGAGRGRSLGFPTANIRTQKELLPKEGVYAVKVRRGERMLDGVANLGRNPTFGLNNPTVEVYLFDFDESLYGETLRIYFMHRLRDEIAFPSVAALRDTIACDVVTARHLLQDSRVVEYREYLDCGPSVMETAPT